MGVSSILTIQALLEGIFGAVGTVIVGAIIFKLFECVFSSRSNSSSDAIGLGFIFLILMGIDIVAWIVIASLYFSRLGLVYLIIVYTIAIFMYWRQ